MSQLSNDNGFVIYVDIIEAKLTEECHCFVECNINNEILRTKLSQKSINPTFNFRAGPLTSSKKLIFSLFKIKRFGKKPIEVGSIIMKTSKLGIDIPIDEWISVVSPKGIVAALHLRLTRSELTKPPRVKKVGERWVILRAFDRFFEESPIPLPSRKNYLHISKTKQKPKVLCSPNGMFLGVAAIGLCDVMEDLKIYFRDEETPQTDPLLIPFSGEIKEMYPSQYDKIPSNIWLFCFPDGLRLSEFPIEAELKPFVMTDADGTCRYAMFLVSYEKMNESESNALCKRLDCKIKELYFPRALALFCEYPLFNEMSEWLWGIYNKNFLKCGKIGNNAVFDAFDSIFNKTQPIALGNSQEVQIHQKKITITFPKVNDLPSSPFILGELFSYFNKTTIIQILNYILLGERIVFTSSNNSLLVRTIENFKLLLFPLQWVCVCVPILPRILLEYLTSPFPYILGLPSSYRAEADTIFKEEELILIDIDNSVIHSSIKHVTPDLPSSITNTLFEDLLQITIIDFDYSSMDPWNPPTPSNISIQLCFFKAVIQLLLNYKQFIGYTWISNENIIIHFNDDQFILSHPPEQIDFLKSLTETQSFKFFCESYSKITCSIVNEWMEKNIYKNSILTLTKFYKATEEHPLIFNKVKDPFKLSDIHIDTFGLLNNVRKKEVKKPIMYSYCLDCLKVQIINNKIEPIVGSKFIDKLIKMNNNGSPIPEIGMLFNDLSDIKQRYNFLNYLQTKQHCFILKEFGPGNVTKECALILIEIFKTIGKFCVSQHDRVCAVLMLQISLELCRIENIVQEPLCIALNGMPLWEDSMIWIQLYYQKINESKAKVLNIKIEELKNKIPLLSFEERKKLVEKENQEAIGIIHEIAKTMKDMNMSNDFINTFVARISTMLPFSDTKRDDLKCIINVITRISIIPETFESDNIYDSIYF
ncbi:hypothetical protein EDI_025690 [Entamoeba dispar SAW760]|uniref:UDENN domain-containing protein n=1 Tax=Entamoeba dispar (strain ATCC PRA-260 / SAW760) TaxID=370354 RepID=B0EBJ1_ENTDS|nr:uncharacterized protein EDI_025690 [Entamoeba dispar SAW760]EDR28098.1 hypothetical protein EDI_025690 [Entamoeba dispar SAW760]|eukprot:EDR28098.1 hypothetical protein EDI_025690 [Entamoeba dispar SAW760]